MCDFKEMQQGHWRILTGALFVCKKWVRKLAGAGFLYTDKSRMKKV